MIQSLGSKTQPEALVIYPEAAWPHVIDEDTIGDLRQLIRNMKRDVLIGAVLREGARFYNAAFLFAENATLKKVYRKIKLVPYGEYIPLRKYLGFIDVINTVGDMSAGGELAGFTYRGKRFGVLICFEDTFSLLVRHFAKENDFLINITNDGWFYGEPQASQHLAIMVMRAVENRISIIRSANTGISGWVSFKGEIEKVSRNGKEVFFPAKESFSIELNNGRSFYNKYGEWFVILCGLIVMIALASLKTNAAVKEVYWR